MAACADGVVTGGDQRGGGEGGNGGAAGGGGGGAGGSGGADAGAAGKGGPDAASDKGGAPDTGKAEAPPAGAGGDWGTGPFTDCKDPTPFSPPFSNAKELCGFINSERPMYASHERWRGEPWSGTYHTMKTWPYTFTIDSSLNDEAQAEADRLAKGGSPKGNPHMSSSWGRTLYVAGVNTSDYQVTGMEELCDYQIGKLASGTMAMSSGNGSARMALYYQDPGGMGPVLTRIGCGGAAAPGTDRGMWWVVKLR